MAQWGLFVSGFVVVSEALARAGGAGQGVVERLAGAECGAAAERLAGAVPGGETAGAVAGFAAAGAVAFAGSRTDASGHADALTTATGAYATGDAVAAEALPVVTGPGAGRVGGPV